MDDNTTAAIFSNATTTTSACPLRAGTNNETKDNIEYYKTISKIVVSGNVYSIVAEEDRSGTGCTTDYNKTALSFTPSTTTIMYGNFETAEVIKDCAGSGANYDDKANFKVKFVKQ